MDPDHHAMPLPPVADGGKTLIWKVAENILNKKSWTTDNGCLPGWWLGELLTTPQCKNKLCCETVKV